MSIPTEQICSEERYYGPFLCRLCKNLVALDAVVTNECSHAFCRGCFAQYVSASGIRAASCPSCNKVIISTDEKDTRSMMFSDAKFHVQPLVEQQPLAYHVLRRLVVSCPNGSGCEWSGEYEALSLHAASHSQGVALRRPSMTRRSSLRLSRRRLLHTEQSLPSVSEAQPVSNESIASTSLSTNLPSKESLKDEFPINNEEPRGPLKKHPERSLSAESLPMDPLHDSSSSSLDLAGKEALSLKSQANQKFKDGDFEAAQKLYSKAIALLNTDANPSKDQNELHSSLYCNRAVTFHKQRRYLDCISDCQEAIRLNPQNSKAYQRGWKALVALGRIEEACLMLETASNTIMDKTLTPVEDLRRTRELKRQLSLTSEHLGHQDVEPAARAVDSLLKSWDNPAVVLMAARVDIMRGKPEEALVKCIKVLEGVPSQSEALHLQAYATFLKGEMDKAMELLKAAHEKEPENAEIVALGRQCRKTHKTFAEGQLLVCEGDYEKAVDCFTSALGGGLRIPPKCPLHGMLLVERGEALLICGQHREALLDAQQAIEEKEANVRAWIVMCESLFAMGRPREALHELSTIRRTWASGNAIIDEAHKKAEFEVQVQKAEMELKEMVMVPSNKRSGPDGSRHKRRDSLAQSEHSLSGSRHRRRRRDSAAGGDGLDRATVHVQGVRRSTDRERRRQSIL